MGREEEDQALQEDVGHTRPLELTGHQEHQHGRAEDCKETHPGAGSLLGRGASASCMFDYSVSYYCPGAIGVLTDTVSVNITIQSNVKCPKYTYI